jgi:hypothetical protein
MSLLNEEEETQRALITAAITASGLSCWDVWRRYVDYTGIVNLFGVRAYFGGLVSLPVEECNLLAHAVNELIDERPPPPRAPHRGPVPWSVGPWSIGETSVGKRDTALDEVLTRWLMDTSHEKGRHLRDL